MSAVGCVVKGQGGFRVLSDVPERLNKSFRRPCYNTGRLKPIKKAFEYMKPMFKKISAAALVLVLAACSSHMKPKDGGAWPERADVDGFAADGRLSVKVNEKGSYANFDWTYQNQVQTINVNTPLGNTVGQLCKDTKGVLAVDSKGKKYQAGTAEELSERLLGYALPVQHLHLWANGYRAEGGSAQVLPDGRLQQYGWVISRTVTKEGKPRMLQLENPKLILKLVFSDIGKADSDGGAGQCAARGR